MDNLWLKVENIVIKGEIVRFQLVQKVVYLMVSKDDKCSGGFSGGPKGPWPHPDSIYLFNIWIYIS